MFFIDGHCDTLSKALDENKDLFDNNLQFSFKKVKSIGGGVQVMACFIDTEFLNENKYGENAGFNRCKMILDKLKDYELSNNLNITIKNKKDLLDCVENNSIKVILSIENGSAISKKIENIEYLYNRGIRVMSVTWNDDNELGCGAHTLNDTGLTRIRH